MRRLRLAAAVVLAAACAPAPSHDPAPAPARGGGAAPPADEAGELLYVANQDDGTVTVVDLATLEPTATVDVGALVGSGNPRPHHLVAEPGGSHWYVSLIGANEVLKLTRDNRLAGRAAMEVPGMLALDPASDRLYAGRSMSAVNPPERIGVIDRSTMAIEELSVFFPRPHALAAHPSLPLVYSASLAGNSMAVVEPVEEDVDVRPIPAPPTGAGVHTLVQWAVSPDGATLVGTGEMSGRLLVYTLADPAAPELLHQLEVESRPWHPVFTPDGSEVWFANKGSDAVTVVDARTWTVSAVVRGDGLAEPHGAAISGDGRYVFVSSNDLQGRYPGEGGTVTVIDRERREIVRVIPVGRNAAGVATNAR